MNKQQYLNFMKKYASKNALKKKIQQQRNADGTFASKMGPKTINLQRYRQKKSCR